MISIYTTRIVRIMMILAFLQSNIETVCQPVLVEEFVEAAGLICFPVHGDSNVYKYLPSRGRLAVDEDDMPEFSFLQYVTPGNDSSPSPSSITEASGGGLIHFLVQYDTPEDQVRSAERELKRKLRRSQITLAGPVDISAGRFMLVSSLLIDGEERKELIGSGHAPVFQNSKVAFSFLVDPLKSQILMESFRTSTPDISIMFDLQFTGLTSAYSGNVIVDWSQVQRSEYSSSSTDAIFYSSDVEKTFGSLVQSGAIRMESFGNDSLASDMLSVAYDLLLKLMFEPVRPDSISPEKSRGVIEEVFGRRGLLGGLIGGSNIYKKQVIKTSGKTVVQLNTRKMVERHHFVTFNIGDVWKRYGTNPQVFRKVAIDDAAFQQREVHVNLDGSIRNEFEEMISSVSVTLRKRHENGEQTIREIFLSRDKLKDYTGDVKLIYLNKADTDRSEWLNYDFLVNWQFAKDGNYVTEWTTANNPIINLFTPYTSRHIELLGDFAKLRADGIVAVAIELTYPFFGRTKHERLTIRTDKQDQDYKIDAILPRDRNEIDYRITWIHQDGRKIQASGKDEHGIVLVDDMPVE